MAQSKRIFIGVDLTAETKNRLQKSCQQFEEYHSRLRIVPPQNYHITLQFMGDVVEDMLRVLCTELPFIVQDVRSMKAQISSFGHFVSRGTPGVFWFGINSPDIRQLHEKIYCWLKDNGFDRLKSSFSPHITWARARKNDPELWSLVDAMQKKESLDFSVMLDNVTVFESVLSSGPPEYRAVLRALLQAYDED